MGRGWLLFAFADARALATPTGRGPFFAHGASRELPGGLLAAPTPFPTTAPTLFPTETCAASECLAAQPGGVVRVDGSCCAVAGDARCVDGFGYSAGQTCRTSAGCAALQTCCTRCLEGDESCIPTSPAFGSSSKCKDGTWVASLIYGTVGTFVMLLGGLCLTCYIRRAGREHRPRRSVPRVSPVPPRHSSPPRHDARHGGSRSGFPDSFEREHPQMAHAPRRGSRDEPPVAAAIFVTNSAPMGVIVDASPLDGKAGVEMLPVATRARGGSDEGRRDEGRGQAGYSRPHDGDSQWLTDYRRRTDQIYGRRPYDDDDYPV